MYSVKQYFRFDMMTFCGIPAVEMIGTEEDWNKLTSKLKVLRTLLETVENDLGLQSEWWDLVEKVFHKLLETYQGRPDEEWWSHILDYGKSYGSGNFELKSLNLNKMPKANQYQGARWIWMRQTHFV